MHTCLILAALLSAAVGRYYRGPTELYLIESDDRCRMEGASLKMEANEQSVSGYASLVFWCDYSRCSEELKEAFCSGMDPQLVKVMRKLVSKTWKQYHEVRNNVRF